MRLPFLAAVACWGVVATTAHAQRPAPAVAAAHRAQREFERERRDRLPALAGGSGGPCEVQIGRLCYWNNNGDAPPPAEPRAVTTARLALLDRLARAAAADSADDWVVGQQVRYLDEARRVDDAAAVATRCRATAWWCAALRGLAYHERGDHDSAATAFDQALAAMPDAQRCRWTDLSWWLDGALARDYRRQRCGAERDAWERRFWLAARPLLALPGNDLRAELLARRTMSRIRSQGAIEYAMSWGDDFAELEARYGWPTAWSARTNGNMLYPDNGRSVVGHEPTPSFAFVPRAAAVAAPTRSAPDDWELDARLATTRYAPRYAWRGVHALSHQLARFRRGDSTLVVAAWDVAHDRAWPDTAPVDSAHVDSARAALAHTHGGDTTWAALVLVDSAGRARVARRDSAPSRGSLAVVAPPGAYLASVELLAVPRGRAARARAGLAPLPRDTLVSDLLLLADVPPPGTPVERVGEYALGGRTIAPGARIGLYWETYLDDEPGEAADSTRAEVAIQATRIDASWTDRLGRVLGLAGPRTPVAVRFADAPRPGEHTVGRSLALTWPPDAAGTFRLEVSVRSGERTVTATTDVRVVPVKP